MHNSEIVLRGLRNAADLEYEKQIVYVNNKINMNLDTIFFVPPTELANLSSSLVKSTIGFPEWQFLVKTLIPEQNLPFMNKFCYGQKFLDDNFKNYNLNFDYEYICSKYFEKGRYYHTLQHISEFLDLLNQNYSLPAFYWRKRCLFYAALYHDIVYDPTKNDNEEKSVEEFRLINKDYFTSEEIDFISSLIFFTKTHEGDSAIHNLFIDCDLAILAFSTQRFNEYEKQIRAEYSMYNDEQYNTGRRKFVKEMLERKFIFNSDEFKKKDFESKARINLTTLLEQL